MIVFGNKTSRGIVARTGQCALGLAVAMSLAGCDIDDLLSVDDPEFVTDESVTDPNAVPLVVRGALGEFYRAYSGSGLSNLGYLTASGLLTDELQSSDTFVDRNAVDARSLQPPELGNPSDLAYEWLQRARRATIDAAETVAEVEGESDPDRALMLALNGFTYVAFGEGWCSAVPVSTLEGGDFVEGEPRSTEQLFQTALERFQSAQSASASNLAALGRARTLLNLGQYQEAAAAVSGVPTSYVFLIEHSENTYENPVWNLNNDNGRFTILGNEGENGLAFRTADDPRIEVTIQVTPQGNRLGFDDSTPLYEQQKYPNRDADVPLATGTEARLIEAEAALNAGNPGTFLQLLNDLRATVDGLEPLTDPGTQEGRVDLLFRERAFWLYLTGHRLGDMRRLVDQYGRSIDDVYPVGTSTQGQPYGNDVVFSVPFEEEQNSLFSRSACVTTQT
ncbi:MAG: RagB/SusD family nutrient uptake outer membrane protein [Gemmatimonadota bacterium]